MKTPEPRLSDSCVTVCDHRRGAVATWSHGTDSAQRNSFFYAEACAFKYNLAVTVFDSPLLAPDVFPHRDSRNDLTVAEKQAAAETGRVTFQLYFMTELWRNPLAPVNEQDRGRKFTAIPDYWNTRWTQAAIEAGYDVTVGEEKPERYPNHGQQLYDVSRGRYGYDFDRGHGKVDILSELIEAHRDEFKKQFGYYPAAASYEIGQAGCAYAMPKYFLGVRNSLASGDLNYGQSREGNGFLGNGLNAMVPFQSASLDCTTRADDLDLPKDQALRHCRDLLEQAISTRGWYRDFIHWHTNPIHGLTIQDFFDSQRNLIGGRDVVSLDFGESLQHKFLRDMGEVQVRETEKELIIQVTYRDPYAALPLQVFQIPLSLKVTTRQTILAGKEIATEPAVEIFKKGPDEFIIDVPFCGKEETFRLSICEAKGSPHYGNLALPRITRVDFQATQMVMRTDVPTRLTVFIAPRGQPLSTVQLLARSNQVAPEHAFAWNSQMPKDHKASTSDNYDLYIGAITEKGQSVLDGPLVLPSYSIPESRSTKGS